MCAEFLHVHIATLATWRSRNRGPHFIRLGPGSVRYRPEDVRKWLASRVTDPSTVR
ncbi:helix-turn-helix domain-containing protein [Gordonia sp. NPDC003585]|uniref:helix-turn-helix transcriptional regulator n=1 Tax=Gordonia sp. NPDC003585 TaxID=3154275 RepID=UPI0033B2CE1F